MKLTTHIRNLIFLWRMNGVNSKRNKTEIPKNADAEAILRVTKKLYTKKNSWVRNQVAQLIRKIRKVHPYEVGCYSEAKQLYESSVPIDLTKVKEGSYVCKISKAEPKRVGEYKYYVSYCLELGVFKVGSFKEDWEYWNLVKYNGDLSNCTLNYESERSFRFATKEEIQEFKNRRKEYKAKKKEIEALQKQISKLYKEL